MASSSNRTQQKRSYARVDDLLPLSWRQVGATELGKVLSYFEKNRALPPRRSEELRRFMASLDIGEDLKYLQKSEPDLAHLLGRLDMKLNLLLQLFHPGDGDRPLAPTSVNLSGGGLAFWEPHSVRIRKGDILEICLALSMEALTTIDCFVRVVNIGQPDVEGLIKISCLFEPIVEKRRDQLIQHVFKRQSELLRNKDRNKDRD